MSEALAGEGIEEVLVHTGQHHDDLMSDVFFRELGIREPDYHLGVSGGTHAEMTGEMLRRIEAPIRDEKPDVVLVLRRYQLDPGRRSRCCKDACVGRPRRSGAADLQPADARG
jgi:hypothetical protein